MMTMRPARISSRAEGTSQNGGFGLIQFGF